MLLRHRSLVTAWVALSAQALVLVLGTLQVCWDGGHKHGGVAAPDCPMHHQASHESEVSTHHSHHGQAASTDASEPQGPQITCDCSSDIRSIVLGQMATLEVPLSGSPFARGALLLLPADGSAEDQDFFPPSPPPRL